MGRDVHQLRKHDGTAESWREMKWQASEHPQGQAADLCAHLCTTNHTILPLSGKTSSDFPATIM